MTRAELLHRISSQELSGWVALMAVEAEERELAAQRASSSDGDVIIHGRDDDEDDEDTDDSGE